MPEAFDQKQGEQGEQGAGPHAQAQGSLAA